MLNDQLVVINLLIILVIIIVIAGVFYLNILKKNKDNDIKGQISLITDLHNELTGRLMALADTSSGNHENLKNSFDQRIDQMMTKLSQNLSENSNKTGENLTKLNERLAVIDNAQKNITELSSKVVSLQDILSNKQERGAYGQGRMEAIIVDSLPFKSYSFQFTLTNGKRPDCIIRMPDSNEVLVIDSKFPLESFTALKSANNSLDIKTAESRIRIDISKHLTDISEKYTIPGEVRDPLMMFVPSESIYADLYEQFSDLIQKAYKLKIIIVSPNMMMLTVQTMQSLIRDNQMQDQANVIRSEVSKMISDVERLSIRVSGLQKHFNLANQDLEKIAISSDKITSSGRKLESLEFDEEKKTKSIESTL
jgi:DNA recombination protein RmuC